MKHVDRGRADGKRRTDLQLRALAADEAMRGYQRAVRAAEVLDHEWIATCVDRDVMARDGVVVDDDVAILRAADARDAGSWKRRDDDAGVRAHDDHQRVVTLVRIWPRFRAERKHLRHVVRGSRAPRLLATLRLQRREQILCREHVAGVLV